MRIHRLTIAAFGPFADEVDLDVDDLTDSGLFLVHGPTGAGKTSLLDAICFALYAGVPGARDRGATASLRSHHAAEGAAPRVVLEFTAAGRRLRITRSPAWTRAGRATPVPATVSVEELRRGRWQPAGSRHDEVGDIVKDVMGMDRDQFAKVVLLPQGEFAAFLRAGAEDRRKVLERLFDVSTYSGVETWLSEKRRAVTARAVSVRAEADRLRSELLELLARTPAEDPAVGAVDPGDEAGPSGLELVQLVEGRLRDRLGTLLVDSDAAELEQRAATERWARVRELAASRERGRRALAERVGLDAAAEAVERDRARHAEAERAAALRGDLSAADRARAAVAVAQATVARAAARAAAALPAGADSLGADSLDAAPSGTLLEAVSAHDATVAEVDDAAGELARLAQRREALAADAARKDAAVAGARARADALEAQVAALAAERETVAAAAGVLDRANAEHGELTRLLRLSTELARCHGDEAAAEEALRAATDEEQATRDTLLDLRERRVTGMAAELAAGLDDGPCPVCGSTEHPDPARAATAPVTTDAIRDAEARHEVHLVVRQRASGTLEAVRARARAIGDELADEARSGDELTTAVDAASSRRAAAVHAADRLVALDGRAGTTRQELAEVRLSLDAATTAVTATSSALTIVDQQLGEARARGQRARTRHDELCPCGEVDQHASVRELLQSLVTAEGVLASRRADLAAVEAALALALEGSGFVDEAAVRSAGIDPESLTALGREIRAHDDTRVRVHAVLEDADVRSALEASDEQVDVAGAAAAKDRADTAVRRTSQSLGQVRTDHATGQRLGDAYRAATTALAPLEAELAVVTEVADAAAGSGTNTLRMPLSSYVLAARLERVAALANERLAVMGEGRFELRHTDDRSGNAKAGLGLEVVDLWTGQSRATSTLSGGESFMASLALALALADAVREEAGGLDLQTLFIDEGFGTLDDESLEQVLTVLDSLRDGGRVVGVVSHVADLRARIPRQVRVRKAPHGSSIEVSGAAAAMGRTA